MGCPQSIPAAFGELDAECDALAKVHAARNVAGGLRASERKTATEIETALFKELDPRWSSGAYIASNSNIYHVLKDVLRSSDARHVLKMPKSAMLEPISDTTSNSTEQARAKLRAQAALVIWWEQTKVVRKTFDECSEAHHKRLEQILGQLFSGELHLGTLSIDGATSAFCVGAVLAAVSILRPNAKALDDATLIPCIIKIQDALKLLLRWSSPPSQMIPKEAVQRLIDVVKELGEDGCKQLWKEFLDDCKGVLPDQTFEEMKKGDGNLKTLKLEPFEESEDAVCYWAPDVLGMTPVREILKRYGFGLRGKAQFSIDLLRGLSQSDGAQLKPLSIEDVRRNAALLQDTRAGGADAHDADEVRTHCQSYKSLLCGIHADVQPVLDFKVDTMHYTASKQLLFEVARELWGYFVSRRGNLSKNLSKNEKQLPPEPDMNEQEHLLVLNPCWATAAWLLWDAHSYVMKQSFAKPTFERFEFLKEKIRQLFSSNGQLHLGTTFVDGATTDFCNGALLAAVAKIMPDSLSSVKVPTDKIKRIEHALELLLDWPSAQSFRCSPLLAVQLLSNVLGAIDQEAFNALSKRFLLDVFLVKFRSAPDKFDPADDSLKSIARVLAMHLFDLQFSLRPSTRSDEGKLWLPTFFTLPQVTMLLRTYRQVLQSHEPAAVTMEGSPSFKARQWTEDSVVRDLAEMGAGFPPMDDGNDQEKFFKRLLEVLPTEFQRSYEMGKGAPLIANGNWLLREVDISGRAVLTSGYGDELVGELERVEVSRGGMRYISMSLPKFEGEAQQVGSSNVIFKGDEIWGTSKPIFFSGSKYYVINLRKRQDDSIETFRSRGVVLLSDASEASKRAATPRRDQNKVDEAYKKKHGLDSTPVEWYLCAALLGYFTVDEVRAAFSSKSVYKMEWVDGLGIPSMAELMGTSTESKEYDDSGSEHEIVEHKPPHQPVWRVYDTKETTPIASLKWPMTDGSTVNIPVSFVAQNDIECVMSYRWSTLTSDGARSPAFMQAAEDHFKRRFQDYLTDDANEGDGRKTTVQGCWVDCVAHNGGQHLIKLVLQRMGAVYRAHQEKVCLSYYEGYIAGGVSFTEALEDALRLWTFQEQFYAQYHMCVSEPKTPLEAARHLLSEMAFSVITGRLEDKLIGSNATRLVWTRMRDYVAMFRNGDWSVTTVSGFARMEDWLMKMFHRLMKVSDDQLKKRELESKAGEANSNKSNTDTRLVVVGDSKVHHSKYSLLPASVAVEQWNVDADVFMQTAEEQINSSHERERFDQLVKAQAEAPGFVDMMELWGRLRQEFGQSISKARAMNDPASIRSVLGCMTSTCFHNVYDLPKATLHLLTTKYAGSLDPKIIGEIVATKCSEAPEGLSRPIYFPPPGLRDPAGCHAEGVEVSLEPSSLVGTFRVTQKHGDSFLASTERVFSKKTNGQAVVLEYKPICTIASAPTQVRILSAGAIGRGEAGLTVSTITVQLKEDLFATLRSLAGPIPHGFFSDPEDHDE
mmetsp:Transcript_1320/g.3375  ORF Transcript_1320/g.3375 Transcript_1320/m.3375 type:complete len:1491 (+) Transcript_1320:64-4536(+)